VVLDVVGSNPTSRPNIVFNHLGSFLPFPRAKSYSTDMALTLYRRHRRDCKAGHQEDLHTSEFDERKRVSGAANAQSSFRAVFKKSLGGKAPGAGNGMKPGLSPTVLKRPEIGKATTHHLLSQKRRRLRGYL
jgi:hypothetical protein